jgi:hypothetical protein
MDGKRAEKMRDRERERELSPPFGKLRAASRTISPLDPSPLSLGPGAARCCADGVGDGVARIRLSLHPLPRISPRPTSRLSVWPPSSPARWGAVAEEEGEEEAATAEEEDQEDETAIRAFFLANDGDSFSSKRQGWCVLRCARQVARAVGTPLVTGH